MIGAWLENGALTVRGDLPTPGPSPREAVVRVLCAGICGTDLELLRGYRPFTGVPGHEFVGVVEEGPEGWLGERVVSEINVTCLSRTSTEPVCPTCVAGRPAHCERREVIGILGRDGAFAERVRVPVANLHHVPDEIADEAAVFVEPLAAALRIPAQVALENVNRALVLGPGRLGLLVARVLAGRVPCLEVAGRSQAGLARASAAALDVHHFGEIEASSFDLVIECTGSPDGFAVARAATRPGGHLILKSTYANNLEIDISSIVVDEIHLLGSRCGSFPHAIEALERGRIRVLDLIDERLPLREAVRGFERASAPGVAKVLLVP